MTARGRSRTSGFTLLEIIIASTMGILILTAASSLTLSIMKAGRTITEMQALVSRLSLARSYLQPQLSNIGYGWSATNNNAASVSTGTFGQGYCVSSSGVCSSTGAILPLTLTDSTTGTDQLQVIVPRDSVVEALTFTSAASIPAGTTAMPFAKDPSGTITSDWSAGDLVLMMTTSTVDHSNSLSSGFALVTSLTGSAPAGTYTDASPASTGFPIACDSSGALNICDYTSTSFYVIRVASVRVRVNSGALQTHRATTTIEALTVSTDASWRSVLSNVDDLQFQLEILRTPLNGAATLCTANTSAVLSGALFSTVSALTTCTGAEALRTDIDSTLASNRLVALKVGLTVRSNVVDGPGLATAGLFNRTTSFAADGRTRHSATFFIGLPNAQH